MKEIVSQEAAKKRAAPKKAARKAPAKAPADGAPVKKAPAGKAAAGKAVPAKTAAAAKKAPAKKTPAAKKKATAVGRTTAGKATARAAAAEGAAQAARETGAGKVVAKKNTGTARKTAAVATSGLPKTAGRAAGKTAGKTATAGLAPGELAVRPGEDPWTPAEVTEARTELYSEVLRLRAELDASEQAIAGLMRDSGDGAGDDQADTGTKNITRESELALAANATLMLEQTERALERLDAGTYGLCENCGQPIGKARMQAFPRATLCVDCKQKQERRH
ncbi:TraR/DksA family transcriptional regulator [Streptomyces goshikiensis]|uniref:TraR/DksA family transcriptional regulator n=1 Tax=Streptomyces goshikiensis TaxID=1942 RepID=UPI0036CD50C3